MGEGFNHEEGFVWLDLIRNERWSCYTYLFIEVKLSFLSKFLDHRSMLKYYSTIIYNFTITSYIYIIPTRPFYRSWSYSYATAVICFRFEWDLDFVCGRGNIDFLEFLCFNVVWGLILGFYGYVGLLMWIILWMSPHI